MINNTKSEEKQMNVIEFIPSLVMAGAETLVKDYVLKLQTYNDINLLVIVIFRTNSPWEKTISDAGVKVFFLDEETKLEQKSSAKILVGLKQITKLRKIVKSFNPDIFHYHLYISNYVLLAGIARKTTIIYTLHNDLESWKKKRPLDIKLFKLLKKIHKLKIITLSSKMQQEVNDFFSITDSIILNNGIDINHFKSGLKKNLIREQLGLNSSDFVIGNIGRFTEQKNHPFLIKIFNEIHNLQSNSKLLLISGEEALQPKITQQIKEYNLENDVIILYDRIDINDLLNAMDVFVLPSLWEGLGIVLIEAQVAGIWTIASNVVPQSTHISNHIIYLSLDDSPLKWAKKILSLQSLKVPIEYYGLDNWEISNVVNDLYIFYKRIYYAQNQNCPPKSYSQN